MKVIFPHIPKCAGSSIKRSLEKDARFFADYYCHPTWHYDPDISNGLKQRRDLISQLKEQKSWIVFGHFAPYAYYGFEFDYQVIFIRDPLDRAVSHYHYVQQKLPDNDVTVRRHPEVRGIKDGILSFEQFIQLDHIKYFYSNFYLKDLQVDERLIVVPLASWEAGCLAISRLLGITLDSDVWVNKSVHGDDYEYFRQELADDNYLYQSLIKYPNVAINGLSV